MLSIYTELLERGSYTGFSSKEYALISNIGIEKCTLVKIVRDKKLASEFHLFNTESFPALEEGNDYRYLEILQSDKGLIKET